MAMKTHKRLTGSRVTRKQLKRDPFVDRVFDWTLWVRENSRKVAVGAGVILLAVLAVVLYRQSRAAEEREATERYETIAQAYAAGNYQLAANDFRQFRAQFSGSEHADDAALYLADSYYEVGDYPAAIRVLQDFADQYDNSPLRHAATILLGVAYEASGDWVKAADAYATAREGAAMDYQRVDTRMNEARVLVAAGEDERAAEAYRTIVEEHPESARAGEARVRLAELTVEPLRTEAPAAVAADTSGAEATGASPAPAEASTSGAGTDTAGATRP